MKTIYRAALAAAMTMATAAGAMGQNVQSGYFDDNFLYRYQMNPAMGNQRHGFVAMPGLGNLNVGTQGNIGLSHIFYNVDGRTTTLLNPGVSTSEALDGIKDRMRLGVNLRETIIAFGFKGFKGYNTVTLSARADLNVGMPGSLVELAKEGVTNRTYDLSQLGAAGTAWAELALNHSHDVNEKLRIGATVKLLVGAGAVDATCNKANLHLNDDKFVGEVDATIHAMIPGLKYETDYNSNTRRHWVNGADIDGFSAPAGYGGAIDLGAVYRLNDDWEFSLAVTDLGFINWKNDVVATTDGLQQVSTDALHFNVDNNTSWDEFKDNLSMLYQLSDKGDCGSRTTMLGATVTAGARYTLPVWRKVNFGIMNTTHVNGPWTWTEFRLSALVTPCRVISVGVNGAMGTWGPALGGIININAPGFNLWLATDHAPGKLTKQYLPLNSNLNLSMGINIPF